ncbi:MAG: hypothetical protein KF795_08860 [Labilithrix sp.]|nr:hypothetical protein [Labilithrix sp.]
MTANRSPARPTKLRPYVGIGDDVDDSLPTRVLARSHVVPEILLGTPRVLRGVPPSTPAIALIGEMLGELPLAPPAAASRPLRCRAPNVFLSPPRATDPPPPWALARTKARRAASARRARGERRSLLPLFTLAVALALAVGLWRDEAARAQVASDLARAASRAGALLVAAAAR